MNFYDGYMSWEPNIFATADGYGKMAIHHSSMGSKMNAMANIVKAVVNGRQENVRDNSGIDRDKNTVFIAASEVLLRGIRGKDPKVEEEIIWAAEEVLQESK